MSEQLTIKIPGNIVYVKTAKLSIGSAASCNGYNYEDVEDIKMAVGEACKCITCHNHTHWSREYQISATFCEDWMELAIEDNVQAGHDIPKGKCICADCPHEGNLAIDIIRSLMDEVEVEQQGECSKKITMKKNKR